MPYTTDEQELYDFGAGSVPRFLFAQVRAEEVMGAFVKMFDGARQEIEDIFDQTYILNATGTGHKFLDLHARERIGTRAEGESDAALRERIRSVQDQVTRPALTQAAQQIIDAEGILGTVVMVELRWWRAFFNTYAAETGTGGTFAAGTGTEMLFTPDVAFSVPPYLDVDWYPVNQKLLISGAASGGNDGEFAVTSLDDAAAVFTNGSGVPGYDATVSWSVRDYDQDDNLWDGFQAAYLSRGYRMSHDGLPNSFIIIIPYGSGATHPDPGTAASVAEMLRAWKAAGYLALVEYRQSP
jgi:hypothetical protein